MTDGYKLCPRCEEEYTLVAETCVECGVPLVLPGAMPDSPEPTAFPEVEALTCVRAGPLPWTRTLSEALTAAGIEHRVERDLRSEEDGGADPDRFGGEIVYGTWVLPVDHPQAVEIDGLLFAHFEPEAADESVGDEVCPACQEPLQGDGLACGSCGLTFG